MLCSGTWDVAVLLFFKKKEGVPWSLWLARGGESRRRQIGVCLPDFTPPINFTSFFPSRFTPLSTLVSGPPAQRSRNTGLQLPAMMPSRLMAYTNVSGGRPGWPADRQVYTHLLRARPAVIARAATADRTIMPVVLPPGMPALELWQTHSHEL